MGRGEIGIDRTVVRVDEVLGDEGIAVVEGQARAEMEGVLESVRRDVPGLCQVGHQAKLLVELNQTGEEIGDQLAGNDPEVDLGGIEGRNLGESEAEAKGAAGLRVLAGWEDRRRGVGMVDVCETGGETSGAGGGSEPEQCPSRDIWSAQGTPVKIGHQGLLLCTAGSHDEAPSLPSASPGKRPGRGRTSVSRLIAPFP